MSHVINMSCRGRYILAGGVFKTLVFELAAEATIVDTVSSDTVTAVSRRMAAYMQKTSLLLTISVQERTRSKITVWHD